MKYSITKNWIGSFEIIRKRPIILAPFAIIALLEGLALEIIYFFPQKPISFLVNPVIKKFFGEIYCHYPGNLVLMPRVFYYAQVLIYCLIGVLLAAVSINVFKNIKEDKPLKIKAFINNATKRYLSFLVYGIIAIALTIFLKKADVFILFKTFGFASKYAPSLVSKLYPLIVPLFLFITNIILQVFIVLVIPIMVLKQKSLLKAFLESIYLGLRNFLSVFILIIVPFLVYLPLSLLKSFSDKLIQVTMPEINIIITVIGIIIAMVLDCFIVVCASQFLMDIEGKKKK